MIPNYIDFVKEQERIEKELKRVYHNNYNKLWREKQKTKQKKISDYND